MIGAATINPPEKARAAAIDAAALPGFSLRELSADERKFAEQLQSALKLSRLAAELLVARGIGSVEDARQFLRPSFRDCLPDPKDMRGAVDAARLMLDYAQSGKLITLYSDFDVDGLTAAAQLYIFLREIGANVRHYVPNRFTEGYGLGEQGIDRLAAVGTKLLVTLDCGIKNQAEIERARQLGLQTIIIDHHVPEILPRADVIVNPLVGDCPFKESQLAAAGLAWLMLIVLRQEIKSCPAMAHAEPADPKAFIDLAALGTICDMVPLRGLNRLIAVRGIEALRRTERPGLKALIGSAGFPQTFLQSSHVGFILGPRINAAGRMDDPRIAFELLTTTSPNQAKTLSAELERLNYRRKQVEDEMLKLCIAQISSRAEQPFLMVHDDSFHIGVIGIVAQRLVSQFRRPAAVMAPAAVRMNGKPVNAVRGSIRSVPGFNVAAALEEAAPLLLSGGGHAEAGGFTVLPERVPELAKVLAASAESFLRQNLVQPFYVDARADLKELNFDAVNEILGVGPFGAANPCPSLMSEEVTIESVSPLSGGSLKMRISQNGSSQTLLAWRMSGEELLRKGETVTIAYEPEINWFNGVASVQLNLLHVRPSSLTK